MATARQLSGSMIQTQLLMARQLASPVPDFLIIVVLGWAMLLFASYGVLYTFGAVSVVAEALGSIAVASAVMLIFELSQPYDGNFRISQKGADQLIATLGASANRRQILRQGRAHKSSAPAKVAARGAARITVRRHAWHIGGSRQTAGSVVERQGECGGEHSSSWKRLVSEAERPSRREARLRRRAHSPRKTGVSRRPMERP